MKLLLISVGILMTSAGVGLASEGPFGVTIGADPLELGCVPQERDGFYLCDTLPSGHPMMEFYAVRSTAETGICWVKGIGNDIEVNGFGLPLQNAVDELSSQMATRYGAAEKTDHLSYGSIWDDADDWMMGLNERDRFYSYTFKTNLPHNMQHAFVAADSSNSRVGYPIIEIAFENFDRCKEIESDAGASSF